MAPPFVVPPTVPPPFVIIPVYDSIFEVISDTIIAPTGKSVRVGSSGTVLHTVTVSPILNQITVEIWSLVAPTSSVQKGFLSYTPTDRSFSALYDMKSKHGFILGIHTFGKATVTATYKDKIAGD